MISTTSNHSGYWLVTADTYHKTVDQLGALEQARPLFGNQFPEQLMSLSPWLVATSSITEKEPDVLRSGIVITTQAPSREIIAHLRSLLWASFEGDEVLFRFYDPVVITPMLKLVGERERQCFLGNSDSWSLWDGETQQRYSNISTQEFSLQQSPWWKIKEAHLTPNDDVASFAANIERRLWATLPQAMNALPQPKQFIEKVLHQCKTTQNNTEDAQLFVLSSVVKETGINVDDAALALQLSSSELEQLNKFVRELT